MSTIFQAYTNALLADATYALGSAEQGNLSGATADRLINYLKERMTPTVAKYIGDNYTVVSHRESSDWLGGSGFDGTVWRDNTTRKLTVSMQGTTGLFDFTSDVMLTIAGSAGLQLIDMANWWLRITTPAGQNARQIGTEMDATGEISPAANRPGEGLVSAADLALGIEVNGHSLGGYLAAGFTRLFGVEAHVTHTSTFNSAGFAPGSESAFTALQNQIGQSYGLGRYPNAAEQSNYFGANGIEMTTQNSFWFGQQGQRVELFQEDGLGSIVGIPDPFANHYMYKQTDLLALGAALEKLDSTYTFARLNELAKAGSNIMAASYEGVLDGLRRMLFAPGLGSIPVGDVSDSASTRVTYHQLLKQLTDNAFFKSLEGKVTITLTGAHIGTQAKARVGFEEIAALETLSPIVLSAAGAEGTAALESLWQSQVWDIKYQSWLADRASLQTGGAADVYTNEWIADRSAMLGKVIERNQKDIGGILPGTENLRYYDKTTNTEVLLGVDSAQRKQYLFGGKGDDPLDGQGFADHLYGGDGIDTFDGKGGNGYLQGDAGSDTLNGGEGQDTLLGGTDDDTLDGGAGTDILKGGQGSDTYTFTGTFGTDTILDSDGLGQIRVGGVVLTGGAKQSDNVWESADKHYSFTLIRGNLIIGRGTAGAASPMQGTITVQNWTPDKNLGITLNGAPAVQPPTNTYTGDQHAHIVTSPDTGSQSYDWNNASWAADGNLTGGVVEENYKDVIVGSNSNDKISGLGGGDALYGGGGNDQIDGGEGDDLIGGAGVHFDMTPANAKARRSACRWPQRFTRAAEPSWSIC